MNLKPNLFLRNISVIVFILFFNLLFTISVLAQDTGSVDAINEVSTEKINNPINADSIPKLVEQVLEGIIRVGIPLIALAIIYSGFLFVTAIGNPGKVEEAKSALLNTVIGAAILLGAWALAQLISETVLSL